MNDSNNKKYKAFISYSHKDEAFAKWLHKQIETWKVPKDLAQNAGRWGAMPTSLRPVFRDRDDFSGGHSLKEATLAALTASDFLVVICSPNSASSVYVSEEIRLFKLMGKSDRVIPLIYSGEPGDPDNECFPDTVKFVLDEQGKLTDDEAEPIAPDARDQGDGKHRATAKVVAGLLGVTFDEIIRREESARKKRIALLSGIGAGAVIFATVFASFALWQSHQAELAINKSVFAIGGLIQETDSLSENSDIELTKESMLLSQCDLQQGLALNPLQINALSRTICLSEQAKARLQNEELDIVLQDLNEWRAHLAKVYKENQNQLSSHQDSVLAYIRVLVDLLAFNARKKAPEKQDLSELNQLTQQAGIALPEQDYIREINEEVFWQYESILEDQSKWGELETLLINTIKVRTVQAKAFAYDEFNQAKAQVSELQRMLAWVQFGHLNKSEAAVESATKSLSFINELNATYPDDPELLYSKSEVLTTLGNALALAGQRQTARSRYSQALEILIRLSNIMDLNRSQLEHLKQSINHLNEKIGGM